MPALPPPTFEVSMNWHPEGAPVLYIIGKGRVTMARHAIDVLRDAVRMIEESQFSNVCSVYNLLDVTQLPFLGRFVSSGEFPTTQKTAHIVLATHNQAIRMIAALSAVALSKRLRTVDICTSNEEIDELVARWLALPEQTRAHRIENAR